MNLALLILQYFLFSFILFCIRVSALIYRYRHSIIQHEFQFSQITYLLIWAVRWVVLPLTFLGIISEIVTTQNFWLIIVLIGGYIIPFFFFLGKKPKNLFLSAIDDYFYTRRTRLFDSCPHCKECKVFYCNLYEVEPTDMVIGEQLDDNCYYLLNKEGQLFTLGFLFDSDSPALAFIEEPQRFNTFINQYFPLIEPYQSLDNLMVFDDVVLWQEPNLYCSNCHNQVNQSPIFYGKTILK